MSKRTHISKRVRFEVFKRDSFTCQYCGRMAPEVILELEHVHPVAHGGTGDVLNLLTSCHDCNAGKSDKTLSDDSALIRQRKELTVIAERREQIEMMVKWRVELQHGEDVLIDSCAARLQELADGIGPNDLGRNKLRQWIKAHSYEKVMEAIDASFSQYYRPYLDDKKRQEAWAVAFYKIPNICKIAEVKKEKPYLQRLFYIRGILRNRCGYFDAHKALVLLETAFLLHASLDSLEELAKSCRNWSAFSRAVEEYINEHEPEQDA